MKNGVRYEYGDEEYFDIGLYTSPNLGTSKQTFSWNKFGVKNQRSEFINAGMYIMENNGRI